MKVKLLKKVRKRFEIFHLPNGFTDYDGNIYDSNLFVMYDNNNEYNREYVQLGINTRKAYQFCCPDKIFNTEKECMNYLFQYIILRLRKEGYKGRKDNVRFKSSKKVWYVGK